MLQNVKIYTNTKLWRSKCKVLISNTQWHRKHSYSKREWQEDRKGRSDQSKFNSQQGKQNLAGPCPISGPSDIIWTPLGLSSDTFPFCYLLNLWPFSWVLLGACSILWQMPPVSGISSILVSPPEPRLHLFRISIQVVSPFYTLPSPWQFSET